MHLLDFAGTYNLHLEAESARHRGSALQFLEAFVAGRQTDRTVLLEARGLAGLRLQTGVQVGGVLGELGQVGRRSQLPHQPGGVPRRAAG
jgi:hypothetical protein